jgi:Chlorophyll A-B binding protein
LAEKLNPVLKYFDPLDVTATSPWGFTNEQTIGWYRHSEIKHGRVAMMAFVGYVVQSNFHFPWALTLDGTPHPSVDLSPPEQWDALPFESKLQIILFIGFLEFYSELTPSADSKSALPHYVNGGVPGKYPTFEDVPHPVPFNLYDPFGLSKKRSSEAKARGLVSEINNGRLAMLGIMYVGNARCSCVGNFAFRLSHPHPSFRLPRFPLLNLHAPRHLQRLPVRANHPGVRSSSHRRCQAVRRRSDGALRGQLCVVGRW